MRFVLQDKESLIKRLEFKLQREINDRKNGNMPPSQQTGGFNQNNRDDSLSPAMVPSRLSRPESSYPRGPNKENSPSPADVRYQDRQR